MRNRKIAPNHTLRYFLHYFQFFCSLYQNLWYHWISFSKLNFHCQLLSDLHQSFYILFTTLSHTQWNTARLLAIICLCSRQWSYSNQHNLTRTGIKSSLFPSAMKNSSTTLKFMILQPVKLAYSLKESR